MNSGNRNRVHSLDIADPNYREALDIFMLLNRNNDGYIRYEETKELRDAILSLQNIADRGKIDSEDKFREMFFASNSYSINF